MVEQKEVTDWISVDPKTWFSEILPMKARIAKLEDCLQRIAERATCESCKRDMKDGYVPLDPMHSCATEIAREGLK